VGSLAGGVDLRAGPAGAEYTDQLGHGTAVAGVIRAMAPECELYAVRIFGQQLRTNIDTVFRGLAWCLEKKMDIINLSLGSTNAQHRTRFEHFVAQLGPTQLVSALCIGDDKALPGCLGGVVGVREDAALPHGEVQQDASGWRASPWPRPIPGRRQEENLHGISFAVAHVSGWLAYSSARRAT
jgi:hypothetical protein